MNLRLVISIAFLTQVPNAMALDWADLWFTPDQQGQRLMDQGVTINRPPRDGRMAFVRTPDNISVELLQKGDALPVQEPWASMPNTGEW